MTFQYQYLCHTHMGSDLSVVDAVMSRTDIEGYVEGETWACDVSCSHASRRSLRS